MHKKLSTFGFMYYYLQYVIVFRDHPKNDVAPEGEGGGTPKRQCEAMGGGTPFQAKATSFFGSHKYYKNKTFQYQTYFSLKSFNFLCFWQLQLLLKFEPAMIYLCCGPMDKALAFWPQDQWFEPGYQHIRFSYFFSSFIY